MNYGKPLTPSEVEWLKEHFPTHTNNFCRRHLGIGYDRFLKIIQELKLERPKGTHGNLVDLIVYKKKKVHIDEEAKGYCLDCLNYREGGICIKSGKWVGALWEKKCFKGKV